MCLYLCAKFEVSSIILMSFRQGDNFTPPPPTSKRTPKKPTQIRVNIQNINSNTYIIFLKFFQSFFFMENLFLPSYIYLSS